MIGAKAARCALKSGKGKQFVVCCSPRSNLGILGVGTVRGKDHDVNSMVIKRLLRMVDIQTNWYVHIYIHIYINVNIYSISVCVLIFF